MRRGGPGRCSSIRLSKLLMCSGLPRSPRPEISSRLPSPTLRPGLRREEAPAGPVVSVEVLGAASERGAPANWRSNCQLDYSEAMCIVREAIPRKAIGSLRSVPRGGVLQPGV
uniref:Uncharacterized protein n=1 Tax=Ananas comosus var. bracteatus TaxID=296719 RepID=A0A6V7NLT7_ANACO|nr:unnamed protein product [Ananas comosus var. bracteatus]